MTQATTHNLSDAQRERLARFRVSECVDVHCHCLPGLDDGPATMEQALDLCRALVDDGVTTVIATPHQLGRFDGQVASDDIRKAVDDLGKALAAEGVPLSVVPGADVRVDERIPSLLRGDRILTLADDGRYLLLELPHEAFLDVRPLLEELVSRGITPILSHPERNRFLLQRPEIALSWAERGALLQVTAAGLLGDFGPAAERASWQWLRLGAVALVASDAHDTDGRRPRVSDAIDAIARRLGTPAAFRLCMLNPVRVLAGKGIPAFSGTRRPGRVHGTSTA